MSAPTNAAVLAVVVPITLNYAVVAADERHIEYVRADPRRLSEVARQADVLRSNDAPHTVQQLARVVRVVAEDDAMVERVQVVLEGFLEECEKWPEAVVHFREWAQRAIAAALTPPEPTGNSSVSPAERNLSVSPEPTGTEGA